jgi:predicted metal-dependent peptidase
MSASQDAIDKLAKAKYKLMAYAPFYASIVYASPMIEADWLDTMATDMRNIYYSLKFVEDTPVSELVGVLAHEALHIAYGHGVRRGVRDPKIWNYAADYVINDVILEHGLELPAMRLHDPKYRGMSTEQVYDDVEKNAIKITISFPDPNAKPEDGDGKGDEKGKGQMWGGVIDAQGVSGEGDDEKPNGKQLSEAQRSELEQEIKIKVQQAIAAQGRKPGKLPAGIKSLIEAVGKPVVNWGEYIQQWVSGQKPDDYTWQRPNRSWLVNQGIYMPRMQFNGAGNGVLSIDASGSVSDAELVKYVTEITGVIGVCNPDRLHIIQHDAVIHRVDEWEAGMDFKDLKVVGRGGTCIKPTFDWVAAHDEPIDWMIVFSDMEICDWPAARDWPDFPTLLCGTGPDTSPKNCNATYIDLRDAMRGL